MEVPADTRAEEIAQIERRVLPVLAKHFMLFYTATIIIATLVCYHKILTVLPHSAITTGVAGLRKKTYQTEMYDRYGKKYIEKSFARNIQFSWRGNSYTAVGGWDEFMSEGARVNVILNANHPENAYELSVVGLIDFPIFRRVVPVWILLSGILFAFASSDSHFTTFNFNIPNLKTRPFICLLVALLLLPLLSSADLLVFGKKTTGVMTGDFDCSSGRCLNAVVFNAGGVPHSIFSQYANEYEQGYGNQYPVLYRPDNPDRCCIYQFGAMYSNYLVTVMIFSLLVVVAWFLASRA